MAASRRCTRRYTAAFWAAAAPTMRVMAQHGIEAIDLVVVNLYPFEATIARPDVTAELAIENIDIGGPAMIRSAAKNHADVLVIVDPNDYEEVRSAIAGRRHRLRTAPPVRGQGVLTHRALRRGGRVISVGRRRASSRTCSICSSTKRETMRYGENPHQRAALYVDRGAAQTRYGGRRAATAGQRAVVQQRGRYGRRARVRQGLRRAGVRHRQAREPVRRRDRRRIFAPRMKARMRPTLRRRTAASSPSIGRSMRRRSKRSSATVRRSGDRAGDRCGRDRSGQTPEERACARVRRRWSAARAATS